MVARLVFLNGIRAGAALNLGDAPVTIGRNPNRTVVYSADETMVSADHASIVFRGGSTEFGALNAYTREYTFGTAYRYYGVRASSVTLGLNNGVSVPAQFDGDPELDAVMAAAGPVLGVPEPETYAMLLAGLGLLGFAARRRNQKAA